ncbi:MAG TPA: TonB C-terminal domain-containing protein [Terriglobales bacterium]|nr:TonB C-terminal domain-containing protein [Terriglobales bacterium]
MRRLCPAALSSMVVLFSSLCPAKEQAWVEVRSPNFIVVSNAGEKQARKVAVEFEQIRTAFRQLLENANRHPSPLVTILAVKDESSMRELLPEYWTKAHSHPAGFFAARLNDFYAAVQLDARGLNPYETIYHEYYHTISVPYVPNLPVWLAEGLAEFYGHTEITENAVNMGEVDPLLLHALQTTTLIPLDVLFKVNHSSPYYNEANQTSVFYAESWALSHYLLLGGNRMAHRPMLDAYVNALTQVSDPDEAARIAFGDVRKLQSDLETYIRSPSFQYLKYPAPRVNEDEMKFRTLSDAEASAYRGGFAVVRGRYEEGKAILNEALQHDPKIALAHQYLAADEFLEGQHDQAVESASQAIALDPQNWSARYLRAYLKSNAGMGASDPQIEDDLRRAIALRPEFAPPYSLLAVHLAAGNRNLDEALTLAQKAVAFEPANSTYQLALAQVLIHQDKVDEADLAARRASAWARDPGEKTNADHFRQFLSTFRKLQSESASEGAVAPLILPAQNAPTDSPSDSSSTPKLRPAGDAPSASASGNSASILRLQSSLSTLGNSMGVDFSPYFKNLMEAIRKNLMSSVSNLRFGSPKDITLELVILKDGTISEMNVVSSSGDDAVDQSTLNGITLSRPLPPLPAAFPGQSVKFRLHLSYLQEHT